MSIKAALLLPLLLLGACRQADEPATLFPEPQRPVAPIVSSSYSNEDARDSIGEAETVMQLAEIRPGMFVADIGAGEGYYTVRLSPLVGRQGRVLAQDDGRPRPLSLHGQPVHGGADAPGHPATAHDATAPTQPHYSLAPNRGECNRAGPR